MAGKRAHPGPQHYLLEDDHAALYSQRPDPLATGFPVNANQAALSSRAGCPCGGLAAAAAPRPQNCTGASVGGNRKCTRRGTHPGPRGLECPGHTPQPSGRSTAPTRPPRTDTNNGPHSQGSDKLPATSETSGGSGARQGALGGQPPPTAGPLRSAPERTPAHRQGQSPPGLQLGRAGRLTRKRQDPTNTAHTRMARD